MSPLAFLVRLEPRSVKTEIWNGPFSLSLGNRRGRRHAGLRRDRGNVFAAGAAAVDHAGYRLVGRRRVERDDDRFSGDGVLQYAVGHLVRPIRAAAGGAVGIDGARGKSLSCQPG